MPVSWNMFQIIIHRFLMTDIIMTMIKNISNPENIKKMVKMIDQLEDNDDVQNVYHNWEIPEDLDIE